MSEYSNARLRAQFWKLRPVGTVPLIVGIFFRNANARMRKRLRGMRKMHRYGVHGREL